MTTTHTLFPWRQPAWHPVRAHVRFALSRVRFALSRVRHLRSLPRARARCHQQDVMLHDELGMEAPDPDEKYDYLKSGAFCFASFLVCGSVPLLGYVCVMPFSDDANTLFAISCSLTAVALFLLGALKSRYTAFSWWRSGLEVLSVGGSCAAAAYGIGALVELILVHFQLANLSSGEMGHAPVNGTGGGALLGAP